MEVAATSGGTSGSAETKGAVGSSSVAATSSSDQQQHDVQYYMDQGYSRVQAIKLFYENSRKKDTAAVGAGSDADGSSVDTGRPKLKTELSVREKINLFKENASSSKSKRYIDSEIDLSSPSRPMLRFGKLDEDSKRLYGNSKSSGYNLNSHLQQDGADAADSSAFQFQDDEIEPSKPRREPGRLKFQSADGTGQREEAQAALPGRLKRINSDMPSLDLRPLRALHPSRFNSDYSLALTDGSDIDPEDMPSPAAAAASSASGDDSLGGEEAIDAVAYSSPSAAAIATANAAAVKDATDSNNATIVATSAEDRSIASSQKNSNVRMKRAVRKPINYDEYLSKQNTLSLEERAAILRAGFDSPAPISGVHSRDGRGIIDGNNSSSYNHSAVQLRNSHLTLRGKYLADSGGNDEVNYEEMHRRGLLSEEQFEELTFSEMAVAAVSEATQDRLQMAEREQEDVERQRQLRKARDNTAAAADAAATETTVEHQDSFGSNSSTQRVSTEDIDCSRSVDSPHQQQQQRQRQQPQQQQQSTPRRRQSETAMQEASQFYTEVQNLINKGYTRDDALLILRGPEYLRLELEDRQRQLEQQKQHQQLQKQQQQQQKQQKQQPQQQSTPPPYSSGPPPAYSGGSQQHRDDHSQGSSSKMKVPVRAEQLTGFRDRDIAAVMARGYGREEATQIVDEIERERPQLQQQRAAGAPPLPGRSTPARRGSRVDAEHSPMDQYSHQYPQQYQQQHQYHHNPQLNSSRSNPPSRNSGAILRTHSNDDESMLTESEYSRAHSHSNYNSHNSNDNGNVSSNSSIAASHLDNDALLMNLLLSQQKERFGLNMYDALAAEDEPFIDMYMKQGASLDQAVLRVFESRYGSVDPNANVVSPARTREEDRYTRPAGVTPPPHYLQQQQQQQRRTPPPSHQQQQPTAAAVSNGPSEVISYDIADNVEAEIELMMVSASVSRDVAVRLLLNKANKAKAVTNVNNSSDSSNNNRITPRSTPATTTTATAAAANDHSNNEESNLPHGDLSEEQATEVTLLLSQQEADFGINMYDYIMETPALDPQLRQLIRSGLSRHDALLEVFRLHPPQKQLPKTSQELARLQEEAELQAALRISARENQMLPGAVAVPGTNSSNNSVASDRNRNNNSSNGGNSNYSNNNRSNNSSGGNNNNNSSSNNYNSSSGNRRENRSGISSGNSVTSTGSGFSGSGGYSQQQQQQQQQLYSQQPQWSPRYANNNSGGGASPQFHRSSSVTTNTIQPSSNASSNANGEGVHRGLSRRSSASAAVPSSMGIAGGVRTTGASTAPQVIVREQDIALVTAMGFSRQQAVQALVKHSQDVNNAVNDLLGQG